MKNVANRLLIASRFQKKFLLINTHIFSKETIPKPIISGSIAVDKQTRTADPLNAIAFYEVTV
jgi:hypothetical protein